MRNILLLLLLLSSRQNWVQIWQGEALVQAARAQIGVTPAMTAAIKDLPILWAMSPSIPAFAPMC